MFSRRSKGLRPPLAFSLILLVALAAAGVLPMPPAFAIELSSESQFGYFYQRQASSGPEKLGGSGVIFDIAAPVTQEVSLGLRTLGHGAESGERTLYRLGCGGIAEWAFVEKYVGKLSFLYFREKSELNPEWETETSGYALGLDLHRYFVVGEGVSFGVGSLLLRGWGGGGDRNHSTAAAFKPMEGPSGAEGTQTSLTQALSISLKVVL